MQMLKPPHGGKVPGQGSEQDHLHAGAMAHVAANRAKVTKMLGGGGAPPMAQPASPMAPQAPQAPAGGVGGGNYKQHVAAATGAVGPPANGPEIHSAIDSLTQKGRFTPFQGAALKAHNGPLAGPAGVQTLHDISTEVLNKRTGGGPMGGMGGQGIGPGGMGSV